MAAASRGRGRGKKPKAEVDFGFGLKVNLIRVLSFAAIVVCALVLLTLAFKL